jgi:hypothetical protein|tara:strand:+ start:108 stop:362 length:255 start_codon:yes stop_codon:yes gene_type:complete
LHGLKEYLAKLMSGSGINVGIKGEEKMKKIILLILSLSLLGCYEMYMKPHKTSVTYGVADTEKDNGKDSVKESFTVKQEFVWEE